MAGAEADNAQDKPTLIQRLRSNPYIPLILGGAITVTVLAALFLWAQQPNYRTLYTDLSDTDGGEIITQLEQMGVSYKLSPGGHTIKVPASQVDKTRLQLADAGLPKSSGVGLEIMDEQPFGASQFAEHINYKRGLQGELARSIETLHAIKSARVHLAIPEPSVFVRKQEKPRASVTVDLYKGRKLTQNQVSSIIHLVSSSVSKLSKDNISVIDTDGELLSEDGKHSGSAINGQQLEYTDKLEKNIRDNILKILEPIVGRDNVHAQVKVDVDFSQGERTEQRYSPNQYPYDASVRSKQTNLSLDKGAHRIGGIPGALSNEPPVTQDSPINNPTEQEANDTEDNEEADNQDSDLALAKRAGLSLLPPVGDSGSSNSSTTINYELNQTIRHVKKPTGIIDRVSAAVIIDYDVLANYDGDKDSPEAAQLREQRMDEIRNLVRQTVGFSQQRGDSISIVNIPFNHDDQQALSNGPAWWKSPTFIGIVISTLKYLLLLVVALVLWFKLLKPLIASTKQVAKARLAATGVTPIRPQEAFEDDDLGDSEADQQRRERRKQNSTRLRETARGYAQQDPELVAMIVKNWMYHKPAKP